MARFDGGWVKIHRRAILGDIGSNFMRGGLFMALIAMANLRPSIVAWRGRPRRLERGELVTSIDELADLGQIDRKSVLKHLNYLVLRETILLEKCFGGTFIKILNFDKYQSLDAEGSQMNPNSEDSGIPSDWTHSEEGKKERIKESAFDFEFAFAKYPIRIKGPDAEGRFAKQIKTQQDWDDLIAALDHYNAVLKANPWRSPKGNFSTFLGTKRTGFFWRDFIHPDSAKSSTTNTTSSAASESRQYWARAAHACVHAVKATQDQAEFDRLVGPILAPLVGPIGGIPKIAHFAGIPAGDKELADALQQAHENQQQHQEGA